MAGAFQKATLAVVGFASAGVAMSSIGQILQERLTRLSLVVAGLFGPEVRKVIDLIGEFTDWLATLSDSQRDAMATFLMAAVALAGFTGQLPSSIGWLAAMGLTMDQIKPLAMAVAQLIQRLSEVLAPLVEMVAGLVIPILTALVEVINSLDVATLRFFVALGAGVAVFATVISMVPKVIAAFKALVLAYRMLTIAQIVQLAFSGPKGWAMLAGGAIAAAAAIAAFAGIMAASTPSAGVGGAKGGRGPEAKALGGFEDPSATYTRIAQASRQAGTIGKPIDEQQLDQLTMIHQEQQKTNQHLAGQKPAVVNR